MSTSSWPGEMQYTNHGGTAWVRLDDAYKRIAELEAQVANLIADWNKEHPRRLDAEAELEALKAVVRWCYDYIECDVNRPTFEAWLKDRGV